MQTMSEELAKLYQANTDTMMRCTTLVCETAERLLKLQTEIGSGMSVESVKSIRGLMNYDNLSSMAPGEWPSLYVANIDRMMALMRGTVDIAAQTQAELSKLMVENFKATSDLAMQNMKVFNGAAMQSLMGLAGSAAARPGVAGSESRAGVRVREQRA